MSPLSTLCFLFVETVLIFSVVNGQRAKDKMYEQIKSTSACFRKLNGTHQTGCTSDAEGSTGVIHVIKTVNDLTFLLENGTAPPYIPVLPTTLFTSNIVRLLKRSDKISGVVLFKQNHTTPTYYTHESKCPNENFNLDGTCSNDWNTHGTRILHEDFPFPIFYLEDEQYVIKITECFNRFNDFDYDVQYERSLCSLELSSFMFATTDTPTCIRRSNWKKNLNPVKLCDPLGDENVWASLFPLENKTEAQKYIVIASRLDTTSMIHEFDPGAINPVTSIVTLLTTANLLKKMFYNHNSSYVHNVLFVFFNGESYDYIGSQRMVYDMEKDLFPMKFDPNIKNPVPQIRLDDISLFIELNQLSNSGQIVAHILNDSTEVTDFVKSLKQFSRFTNLSISSGILPPGSLHSFLKAKSELKGLILSDHDKQYVNQFYNSIYDDAENIAYKYYNITPEGNMLIPKNSIQFYVFNVSNMVANALYKEITGDTYEGNESANVSLVDELFNCYLMDANCKIHKAIQKKVFDKTSITFYVGVSVMPSFIPSLVGLTLGWLTGDIYKTNNKTCTNDPHTPAFQYFNMSKSLDELNITVCYQTTLNFSEAVSPAFIIPDYDWKSGKYSTWAESTWRDFNMRMYLKPSAAHERFTVALGSITFVLSLILVYFVKTRSHILFTSPIECSPTSC